MSEDSLRLAQAVAAIDAANALDPHTIDVEGKREPAELVYGRRKASELLRIAVRGQPHIERWTSPRKAYVEGRVGYLKWRKDLQDFHARRLGEIMAAAIGNGRSAAGFWSGIQPKCTDADRPLGTGYIPTGHFWDAKQFSRN